METRLLDDCDQGLSPDEELKEVIKKLSHLSKHIENHKECMARAKDKLTDINLEKIFLAEQHLEFLKEIYSNFRGIFFVNPDETDPLKFQIDALKLNQVIFNNVCLKRRAEVSIEGMGDNKESNANYPAMQKQFDLAFSVLGTMGNINWKEYMFITSFDVAVHDYYQAFSHLENLTDQLVYLENEKKGLEEARERLSIVVQEKADSMGSYIAPRRRF